MDDVLPRPATKDALVESPLQLLCAVEAHVAGLGGEHTRVLVRTDVSVLAQTRDALTHTGLPDGLTTAMRAPRAALSPFAPRHRIVGDAFSGLFHASLLTRSTRSLVIVDDGLATLHLAQLLTDGTPLLRAGVPGSGSRLRLARVAARRLRQLAQARALTIFTALPLPDTLADRLSAAGVQIVANHFAWLGTRPVQAAPEESTVIIGSSLAANGLIEPQRYLAWVLEHATRGPLRYIPHRRSDLAVTRVLASTPGVTVETSSLPIELRLAGMRPGQRIVSLPSTAAVLLTTMLSPRGVLIEAVGVPDDWWTDQATPSRRRYLQSALPLVEAARIAAGREL